MTTFDPQRFGPAFAELLSGDRLRELGPGHPHLPARPLLQALDIDRAFAPRRVVDRDMARACLAGLWLLHDFLDESHEISQEIHTTTGSFWHGSLHRREPDASNASYWFRRVGEHPIFATLSQDARELGFQARSDRWNPFEFIDLCERHRGAGTEMEMVLRQVQQREWELLFGWCYTHAVEAG